MHANDENVYDNDENTYGNDEETEEDVVESRLQTTSATASKDTAKAYTDDKSDENSSGFDKDVPCGTAKLNCTTAAALGKHDKEEMFMNTTTVKTNTCTSENLTRVVKPNTESTYIYIST